MKKGNWLNMSKVSTLNLFSLIIQKEEILLGSTLGTAGALIFNDNTVLMVKQAKHGRTFWNFPGGHIEENETPEEACNDTMTVDQSLSKPFRK
jgi:hypothetical protein